MKISTVTTCYSILYFVLLTIVNATYYKTMRNYRTRPVSYYPYRQVSSQSSNTCSKTVVTYKTKWCYDQATHKWITKLQPVRETRKGCCPGYEGENCETQCFDCDKYHLLTSRVKDIEEELKNSSKTIISGTAPGAKGQQGPRGPQGPQGSPGPRGPSGQDGRPGEPGQKGDNGDPGYPGTPGDPGRNGLNGQDGTPGQKGETGEIGIPGAVGIPGNRGPRGPSGLNGQKGNPGEKGEMPISVDEFNIMVERVENLQKESGQKGEQGELGPRGPPGPVGPIGPPGELGSPGPRGITGENGTPGLSGAPGLPGEPGRDGFPGASGLPGISGESGRPGSKGEPGLPGEPGRPGAPGLSGSQGPKGEKGDTTVVEFPISVAEYKLLVNRVEDLEKKVQECCSKTTTTTTTTTTTPKPSLCSNEEFQCRTVRKCVSVNFKCDGIADCDDRSDEDEETCGTQPLNCPEGLFRCDNGQCISPSNKCNGDLDCDDGSDEKGCLDIDEPGSGDQDVNRGDIPK